MVLPWDTDKLQSSAQPADHVYDSLRCARVSLRGSLFPRMFGTSVLYGSTFWKGFVRVFLA